MKNISDQRQGYSYFAVYFFLYSALASWLAFYNIHLLDVGYSGPQIGWINGIMQSTAFFIVPLWGMWADRFGTKKLLLLAIFIDAVLIYFLGYIYGFGLLILFTLLLTFFNHPLGPLTDILTVHYTINNPKIQYGQVRSGGSLGWATGTLVMGQLLLTHDTTIIFTAAFLLLFVMGLVIIFFINDSGSLTAQKIKFSDVKLLIHDRQIVWFIILIFFYGICMAPLHLFINLYYHELQATNAQIGFAFALQAFAEAPIFFIAGNFINKYGAPKIILVSIIITAIRVFLYSQAATPWQAIPFGVLHGLTFSLFWAAAIHFMQSLIPHTLRGTGQALLWAFHLGAGVTIGNIMMGYLYETLGMRTVMKFNGFYAMVMFSCFFIYFQWKNQQHSAAGSIAG